ncbi:hypothetical protein D3C87_1045600 [compost metagenome]
MSRWHAANARAWPTTRRTFFKYRPPGIVRRAAFVSFFYPAPGVHVDARPYRHLASGFG